MSRLPKFTKQSKESKKEPAVAAKKVKVFSRLRGMKDILFDEYRYWNLTINKARELAKTYGFQRVDTPILEKTDLYERSSGKESDVVSKEMYTFVDKSGDRISLRPEGTPGLARAYIEHGMLNMPQPVKMFWLGPIFRHEKPQSGRYRQSTQFALEMFGEASPVADAQLILIATDFFRELQVEVQVQINSIGCKTCRAEYVNQLLKFYKERGRRSKLCPDCNRRLLKNPMRLLDCKEHKCVEMKAEAPQIVDFLCEDCRNHFIKVLEYLDELDIAYSLNSHLVRGLDYYNRTVFEIWPMSATTVADDEDGGTEKKISNENESDAPRQFSLGGGGRYDELVEFMGGRPTPACGFGVGIERTILKIKENNIPLQEEDQNIVFFAQLGDQARRKAFVLFEELRRAGFCVRQSFTKDNLKGQLEDANKMNSKICLILGQKEILDGTILIRDMESGIQEVIDQKKIKAEIEKKFKMIADRGAVRIDNFGESANINPARGGQEK